jgi:uncharacterized delta-60 repeat protein/uncharacterized repeat protein (TIGR01451 family)
MLYNYIEKIQKGEILEQIRAKTALFTAGILLFLCASALCWQKEYGGIYDDYGTAAQQTSDGGYIIAGGTYSYGAGGDDVFLVKTDAAGNQAWQAVFGGPGMDEARAVQQTADGGYIIAGDTSSFGAGGIDIYLIKADSAGNCVWTQTYGGAGSDFGYSVQQTTDGGYIIAGNTSSFGAGNRDAYLIKTDSAGNCVWSMTYGGVGNDDAYCVRQTADGGYIIAGGTYSFGAGDRDMYLVKIDSSGAQQWYQTAGDISEDSAYSVTQTADGGYAAAGYTYSYGSGGSDIFLAKLDGAGTITWENVFGGAGDDMGRSVEQTADGGYIIGGTTDSYGAGVRDMALVKTDNGGNQSWFTTFGGAGSDEAWTAFQTGDGGYAAAGHTFSFGAGGSDAYLVKTDANGVDPSLYTPTATETTQLFYSPTITPTSTPVTAVLACEVSAGTDQVCFGNMVTVIMSVTNSGQGNAINVHPGSMGPTLPFFAYVSGPVPASQPLAAGTSCYFTFVYEAISGGGCFFTGLAAGTDVNTGANIISAWSTSSIILFECTPSPSATQTTVPDVCSADGSFVYSALGMPDDNLIAGGNYTICMTYTAGAITWPYPSAPGFLVITIPPGWPAASALPGDPGYVTVSVVNGMLGMIYMGGQIIIQVNSLQAYTGKITVTYGDRAGGGPGAVAPAACTGLNPFKVDLEYGSSYVCLCGASFCWPEFGAGFFLICPSPTATITPTCTDSATFTITPTYGTPTLVPTEVSCLHRDAAFSADGVVYSGNSDIGLIPDGGTDLDIDSNGKILVAGYGSTTTTVGPTDYNRMFVLRFNADGTYDTSFGAGTGKVQDTPPSYGMCVAHGPGNTVFAGGYTVNEPIVWKYNPDGTPDNTFGTAGKFIYPLAPGALGVVQGLAVDPSGRIVLTGFTKEPAGQPIMFVMRLTPGGALDTSFNGTGMAQFPAMFTEGSRLVIDGSGLIYVTGTLTISIGNSKMLLCRYKDDGTMDTSFNGTGYQEFTYTESTNGRAVSLDASGKVVVAGNANTGMFFGQSNLMIWRYNTDGSPDTSFSGSGFLEHIESGSSYGSGVALDPEGNIFIAGNVNTGLSTGEIALWKFSSAGTMLDLQSFAANSAANAMKMDSAGRLVIAGSVYMNPDDNYDAAVLVYKDDCGQTATPTDTFSPTNTISATLTPSFSATFTCTIFVPTFTPTPTMTVALPASPQLSIIKSVSGDAPAPGAKIKYELEIRNIGTNPVYNIMVWDTLPVQLSFLSDLSGALSSENGQYLLWDLSSKPAASPLGPGDTIYVDFNVQIKFINTDFPIANYAGCDYEVSGARYAPVFSKLVFYPMDQPAVYPNPAVDHVKFMNMVPGSRIEIYTLSAELVYSQEAQDVVVVWYCRNNSGKKASPGVYYYMIRDKDEKVRYRGKIFIIN